MKFQYELLRYLMMDGEQGLSGNIAKTIAEMAEMYRSEPEKFNEIIKRIKCSKGCEPPIHVNKSTEETVSYMKKIISILIPLLLSPILTLAISVSDITTYSSKYQFIASGNDFYQYLDTNSIQPLVIYPTYYAYNSRVFIVDDRLKVITEMLYTFSYNRRSHLMRYSARSGNVWDYSGNKIDISPYRQIFVNDQEVLRGTFVCAIGNKIYSRLFNGQRFY